MEYPCVDRGECSSRWAAVHHGRSVREIADEMGVSQKTVRRDLDLFQRVGFFFEPIVGERGRKRWRLAASWQEPQMNMPFDEALALSLTGRLLEPLAGSPFWRSAHRR